MLIDLHAHSTASDGSSSPTELVRLAAAAGLDVVALTDHDTYAGHAEAAAALPAGLTLVPGVELSCRDDEGTSLHLLAYLVDPADEELNAAMAAVRNSRVTRALRMVDKLQSDGHPVSWELVRSFASGTVGRPAVAQALQAVGLIDSVPQAFTAEWIATGGRYWVGKDEIPAADAVRMVRAAGGVPVVAHLQAAARGKVVTDASVARLAEAGLLGLECDHTEHDQGARRRVAGLAASMGLLTTGGSDFHGTVKPGLSLGANVTPPQAYERILALGTGCDLISG